jgi:hypothetical protein
VAPEERARAAVREDRTRSERNRMQPDSRGSLFRLGVALDSIADLMVQFRQALGLRCNAATGRVVPRGDQHTGLHTGCDVEQDLFPSLRCYGEGPSVRYAGLVTPSPPAEPAPQPEYSEDGIDLSLIRWMRSLTPAERLRFLQDHVNAIIRIRNRNAPDRL